MATDRSPYADYPRDYFKKLFKIIILKYLKNRLLYDDGSSDEEYDQTVMNKRNSL